MRIRTHLVLAAGLALVLAGSAGAQTDGIVIGALPKPGQSQRLRTTQTVQMKMLPDGELPAGFPADGIRIEQSTVTVIRQDVGLIDGDGRVRHDITYESMTQSSTVNGTEVPIPSDRINVLNSKVLTMWLDKNNQVADVSVPEGLPLSAEQAKQMMASLFAAVPREEMHVGQTITKPFSMDLPMPGGRDAPKLSATTKLRLSGVDGVGTDRVANFDMVFDGALKSEGAGSGPAITITLGGTGTMRMDVLSGFVVGSTSEQTIEGRFAAPTGKGPAFTMRGTVQIKTTRLE